LGRLSRPAIPNLPVPPRTSHWPAKAEPGAGLRAPLADEASCDGELGRQRGEQICRGEIHLISQSHTGCVPREARAKAEVTDDKGASDALLQEADTWERMADWEDKSNPPPQNSRLKFRTLPVVRPPHRTVSVPVDASQPAKPARGQKSGMASGKLAGCPIEDSALASTEATFPGWRRKLLLPKPN
jgi:hypothetical protein